MHIICVAPANHTVLLRGVRILYTRPSCGNIRKPQYHEVGGGMETYTNSTPFRLFGFSDFPLSSSSSCVVLIMRLLYGTMIVLCYGYLFLSLVRASYKWIDDRLLCQIERNSPRLYIQRIALLPSARWHPPINGDCCCNTCGAISKWGRKSNSIKWLS